MKKFLGKGAIVGIALLALMAVGCKDDPTGGTIVVKNTTTDWGVGIVVSKALAEKVDAAMDSDDTPSDATVGKVIEEIFTAASKVSGKEEWVGTYAKVIKPSSEQKWDFDDDGDYYVAGEAGDVEIPDNTIISLSGGDTKTVEIK